MNKRKIIEVFVVSIVLLFMNVFYTSISFLKYLDELIVVFLILKFVKALYNNPIKILVNKKYLIVLTTILILVILSTIFNGRFLIIQNVTDLVSLLKVPIVYLYYRSYLNEEELIKLGDIFGKISRKIIPISLIFLVLTNLGVIDMYASTRYGLKAFNFISPNAGTFGYLMMILMGLTYLNKKNTKNNFINIAFLLLIFSTTKGPQLIFVVLFIYTTYFKKGVLSKLDLISFLLITLLLGSFQIKNYITNTSSARFLLYFNAIKIAFSLFPLGLGLGTYGSAMSRNPYSEIYNQIGFNDIWGLSVEYGSFITDNYWAMIIGQFGFLSFILVVLFFAFIFSRILKNYDGQRYNVYRIILYLSIMISTIGSGYLNNEIGVMIFLVLALFESYDTKV